MSLSKGCKTETSGEYHLVKVVKPKLVGNAP